MKILLVEHEREQRRRLRELLKEQGYRVDAVENKRQAFYRATAMPYDLMIFDPDFPGGDGFNLTRAICTASPELKVILLSAQAKETVEEKLKDFHNVTAVLSNPPSDEELFEATAQLEARESASIQKLTRIVCTLGPSTDSEETMEQMLLAGMDVVRLNFSHGTHEEHRRRLEIIRELERKWERPIAVLQDLSGPKIRTGPMQDGAIALKEGRRIVVQAEPIVGTPERISASIPAILPDLKRGDVILLDDGNLELSVEQEGDREVVCRVRIGGWLGSNKGMNMPSSSLSTPSLTEKDRKDLEWGIEHEVDYVALSFVRRAEEMEYLKSLIRERGGDAGVIAKIEKPEAVENIAEIVEAADAIMIARGDMGIEIRASRVPWIQSDIIRRCWQANKPVITATQMLESMTEHTRPTRAEVTDVTVAVKEGTDAVMLSGETAIGKYPLTVVRTMASIIRETEHNLDRRDDRMRGLDGPLPANGLIAGAMLAQAAATMLIDYNGEQIAALSKMDRSKPTIHITDSVRVARRSRLHYSVIPIVIAEPEDTEAIIRQSLKRAQEIGIVMEGDVIAVIEKQSAERRAYESLGSLHLIRV